MRKKFFFFAAALAALGITTQSCTNEDVEIGGIKWATMNVGAESVTDAGLYFAWGETAGYTSSEVGTGAGQRPFKWEDYYYYDGYSQYAYCYIMTNYITYSYDEYIVLDTADDAVNVSWGGNWRMPTKDEWNSLLYYTTNSWTTDYQGTGVTGNILTSKADSSKKLFFPAGGRATDGQIITEKNSLPYGSYWTSELYVENGDNNSYSFYFTENSTNVGTSRRCDGLLIRGVWVEE